MYNNFEISVKTSNLFFKISKLYEKLPISSTTDQDLFCDPSSCKVVAADTMTAPGLLLECQHPHRWKDNQTQQQLIAFGIASANHSVCVDRAEHDHMCSHRLQTDVAPMITPRKNASDHLIVK